MYDNIYIYTQIHINKQNICTECTHMALYLDKAMVCTPFILLPRSWAFGQPRGPAIACAASSCIVRRWWWSGRKLLYWCPEGKVIWCFLVGGFKSFYQQNMGIQPIIGIEHPMYLVGWPFLFGIGWAQIRWANSSVFKYRLICALGPTTVLTKRRFFP